MNVGDSSRSLLNVKKHFIYFFLAFISFWTDLVHLSYPAQGHKRCTFVTSSTAFCFSNEEVKCFSDQSLLFLFRDCIEVKTLKEFQPRMSQGKDRTGCPLQSTFKYFNSFITDNFGRVAVRILHFSEEEPEVQSGSVSWPRFHS